MPINGNPDQNFTPRTHARPSDRSSTLGRVGARC
jgi:hypothetical protein